VKTLAKFGADKLEAFLVELANVRGNDDAVRRFLTKHGAMLEDFPSAETWLNPSGSVADTTPGLLEKLRIINLSSHLQYLWNQKTVAAKQFRIGTLVGLAQQAGKRGFLIAAEVLQPGPFAQALLHLLKSANRTRVCGNPDCRVTPYFFRKRRRQTYCSDVCAEFGQRRAKEKWWSEKGSEWRKNRKARKQTKTSKGESRGTRKAR
jgi:hypothetical protein